MATPDSIEPIVEHILSRMTEGRFRELQFFKIVPGQRVEGVLADNEPAESFIAPIVGQQFNTTQCLQALLQALWRATDLGYSVHYSLPDRQLELPVEANTVVVRARKISLGNPTCG